MTDETENVADVLSVELELDTTEFTEDVDEAIEKLRDLEQAAEDASRAMDRLGGEKRTNARVITEPRGNDE